MSAERVAVLLRAVNVGKRKLSMAGLRAGLEEAGCADVVTYIQSGNAVVTPPVAADAAWFGQVISEIAGFDVPVVLRSASEVAATVAANPYPDAGGTALHVVFFESPPGDPADLDLDFAAHLPESCTLVGRDLYLHLPNGMGRATLPTALEKAGRKSKDIPGTSRNWNTVLKLLELTRP